MRHRAFPSSVRVLLAIGLVAYVIALVVTLLNPSPVIGAELVSRVVALGKRLEVPPQVLVGARVEFGLNVLAFMPLSLLGSLLRPTVSVSAWIAAGFVGSLLVELIQTVQPNRSATHSDVVANTLGAALGALIAWVVLRARRQ